MRTNCRALDIDDDRMASTLSIVFESENAISEASAVTEFERGRAENSPFPKDSFGNQTDGSLLADEASMNAEAYWAALR